MLSLRLGVENSICPPLKYKEIDMRFPMSNKQGGGGESNTIS